MSVRLQKGQKVSLSKDHAGLSKVLIGLGWDEAKRSGGGFFSRKPKPIDCDASAFLLKKQTKRILYIMAISSTNRGLSSIWAII